jgi:ABC-type phosphate/phosphonate transport system ATPase subunit
MDFGLIVWKIVLAGWDFSKFLGTSVSGKGSILRSVEFLWSEKQSCVEGLAEMQSSSVARSLHRTRREAYPDTSVRWVKLK